MKHLWLPFAIRYSGFQHKYVQHGNVPFNIFNPSTKISFCMAIQPENEFIAIQDTKIGDWHYYCTKKISYEPNITKKLLLSYLTL